MPLVQQSRYAKEILTFLIWQDRCNRVRFCVWCWMMLVIIEIYDKDKVLFAWSDKVSSGCSSFVSFSLSDIGEVTELLQHSWVVAQLITYVLLLLIEARISNITPNADAIWRKCKVLLLTKLCWLGTKMHKISISAPWAFSAPWA